MVTGGSIPALRPSATMREAVVQLAERRGIAVIIGEQEEVLGVITSGDLTRLMEREDVNLDVLSFEFADLVDDESFREPRKHFQHVSDSGGMVRRVRRHHGAGM